MERTALVLVLLSAVNATACDVSMATAPETTEGGRPELPPPPPIVELVIDEPIVSVSEETPVLAPISTREILAARERSEDRSTAVRRAYSVWSDMLSGLPRVRREARRRFSRRYSEERLVNTQWPAEINDEDRVQLEAEYVVFSRICVNEANWPHRACTGDNSPCDPTEDRNHAELDCPAIYQVFRHTRASGETLMGTMRRQVRYATEEVEAREGTRARWTQEINLACDRPEHFPETDREGHPLNWDRDYRPRCEDVHALTRRLFAGRDLGPCADVPLLAWGGRCEDSFGACDDQFGRDRGLVPYEGCGTDTTATSNRFWCRPGSPNCPMPVAETPVAEVSGPDAG